MAGDGEPLTGRAADDKVWREASNRLARLFDATAQDMSPDIQSISFNRVCVKVIGP